MRGTKEGGEEGCTLSFIASESAQCAGPPSLNMLTFRMVSSPLNRLNARDGNLLKPTVRLGFIASESAQCAGLLSLSVTVQ